MEASGFGQKIKRGRPLSPFLEASEWLLPWRKWGSGLLSLLQSEGGDSQRRKNI